MSDALRENFADFLPETVEAYERLQLDPILGEPSNFLGAGSDAYVLKTRDTDHVIKLITGYDADTSREMVLEEKVRNLLPGIGMANLEQIVAYNDTDPLAVVTRFVTGNALCELTEEEKRNIPDRHYEQLVRTFQKMHEHAIVLDEGPTNTIYHPENGFTIIDYIGSSKRTQSLAEKILLFSSVEYYLNNIPEYYVPVPEYATRFRDVCGRLLGETIVRQCNQQWQDECLFT